jgi:uncharacterized cupredoxin-like copper-binding protein
MKRTLLAAAIMALITAACGGGNDNPTVEGSTGTTATTAMHMNESTGTTGAPAAGTRTVELKMVDIAYQPNTLSVKKGERIDFVFQNGGAIAHDAFIGDATAQAEHETEMRQGDQSSTSGGGMGMGDEKGIKVDPGKTGRLSYTFDKVGAIEIACHEPGHYAAGMKVAVTVA